MIDLNSIPKFVINLKERTDRLESFNKQFYSFFSEQDSYQIIEGIVLEPTYMACSLSHAKAAKEALLTEHPYSLIMEDDCLFNSEQSRPYADLCFKEIPKEFDILLGGLYFRKIPYRAKAVGQWDPVSNFSATHFYVISRTGMQKLAKFDGHTHIDHWMGPNLVCYAAKKFFAIQSAGYSNIVQKEVDYSYGLKDFILI